MEQYFPYGGILAEGRGLTCLARGETDNKLTMAATTRRERKGRGMEREERERKGKEREGREENGKRRKRGIGEERKTYK